MLLLVNSISEESKGSIARIETKRYECWWLFTNGNRSLHVKIDFVPVDHPSSWAALTISSTLIRHLMKPMHLAAQNTRRTGDKLNVKDSPLNLIYLMLSNVHDQVTRLDTQQCPIPVATIKPSSSISLPYSYPSFPPFLLAFPVSMILSVTLAYNQPFHSPHLSPYQKRKVQTRNSTPPNPSYKEAIRRNTKQLIRRLDGPVQRAPQSQRHRLHVDIRAPQRKQAARIRQRRRAHICSLLNTDTGALGRKAVGTNVHGGTVGR